MNYPVSYTDSSGRAQEISITEQDSIDALRNDYREVVRRYDPKYVEIQRVPAKTGEAMHLKVIVHAPSHYLTSTTDVIPKPCSAQAVHIICRAGYPVESVSAYYAKDHYLASPNVFCSSAACIDEWVPFSSSLITVVDKLVRDMIHDPSVTRYDSMANQKMEQWHKNGVAAGRFPTINPKLLYAPETPPLPPRRTASRPSVTPPPLPRRRHTERLTIKSQG